MTATPAAPLERHFLPNLCSGYAVLVVIVIAELMAIVLSLMSSYYQPLSLSQFALSSFFMQWVGLTSAALLCWSRPGLNRLAMSWQALLVVLLVAADTLFFGVLFQLARHWVMGAALWSGLLSGDVLRNVLIASILTGMTVRYFYVQEELQRRRESELKARIQALQSRIRPHFLFNSMNIISSLIALDPDMAERVVQELSQLFRASLREGSEQVTLGEELELCRHYAHIEQLRLGPRLALEWRLDEALSQQKIPLLTLQPLLENAIYHGVQPRPEGGRVLVETRCRDGQLEVCISNPLALEQARHPGNRMAQENVRHRLQALYGRDGGLEVLPTATQYRVMVRYPLQQQ